MQRGKAALPRCPERDLASYPPGRRTEISPINNVLAALTAPAWLPGRLASEYPERPAPALQDHHQSDGQQSR